MRVYNTRTIQYQFEGRKQEVKVIPAMVETWIRSCKQNPRCSDIKVIDNVVVRNGKHKTR